MVSHELPSMQYYFMVGSGVQETLQGKQADWQPQSVTRLSTPNTSIHRITHSCSGSRYPCISFITNVTNLAVIMSTHLFYVYICASFESVHIVMHDSYLKSSILDVCNFLYRAPLRNLCACAGRGDEEESSMERFIRHRAESDATDHCTSNLLVIFVSLVCMALANLHLLPWHALADNGLRNVYLQNSFTLPISAVNTNTASTFI